MRPFTLFLMVLWGALAFYTVRVGMTESWNLFPVFFGDIARWQWPGQFNFDFAILLFLAASWSAWRGGFTPGALALGLAAFVGGAGFMLPYLTYLAWKHDGDTATVLLGRHAKDRLT